MKRVGVKRTFEEQVQYHLDDGRAPEFIDTQTGRVQLARFLIDKILAKDLPQRPLQFVELGCGAGDITGPYSLARPKIVNELPLTWRAERPSDRELDMLVRVDDQISVFGVDVTPMAKVACARRWPAMEFHLGPVEEVEPRECDLLVMTEFLEHVADPEAIVRAWLPKAKWAIIGHPLDEPDPPIEPGHIWSYTRDDWRRWFKLGGHQIWEEFRFPMSGWDAAILGHSSRVLKPL